MSLEIYPFEYCLMEARPLTVSRGGFVRFADVDDVAEYQGKFNRERDIRKD